MLKSEKAKATITLEIEGDRGAFAFMEEFGRTNESSAEKAKVALAEFFSRLPYGDLASTVTQFQLRNSAGQALTLAMITPSSPVKWPNGKKVNENGSTV